MAQAGGPSYAVELGRLDGLSSTASSVPGKLAPPTSSLDQLTALFATNGLSQTDMIALSGTYVIKSSTSIMILRKNKYYKAANYALLIVYVRALCTFALLAH